MLIIPAIDILDGQCVRLQQGEYTRKTVYSNDPVSIAIKWEQIGAKYLHVVDLDGAKLGYPKNLEVIKKIAQSVKVPIQTGGGIRDLDTMEQVLQTGVQRVVLGTFAYTYTELIEEACDRFGARIAVAIDAKSGRVMIKGWLEKTETPAIYLAKRIAHAGVKTIIYTDISKDGMMEGPNLEAIRKIANSVSVSIIASGGISMLKDIRDLQQLDCKNLVGVIVGKAIYDGQLQLEDALALQDIVK